MADLATLQARLTEAESAYHSLMTGTSTVELEHGDMRTKYTAATAGALSAYIADLRAQIVANGGTLDGTGLRRRAFEVDL
jgi:hypothetical protein